jgi:hypothetical protein
VGEARDALPESFSTTSLEKEMKPETFSERRRTIVARGMDSSPVGIFVPPLSSTNWLRRQKTRKLREEGSSLLEANRRTTEDNPEHFSSSWRKASFSSP